MRLARSLYRDRGARHGLLETLRHIALQLDGYDHRASKSHPVTGLPTREHLAEQIGADLASPAGPHVLGGVRFIDFDRLAAFDLAAANAALAGFAARLKASAKADHTIGQIDRDCFAVWFRNGGDTEAATAEFRA